MFVTTALFLAAAMPNSAFQSERQSVYRRQNTFHAVNNEIEDEDNQSPPRSTQRRQFMSRAAFSTVGMYTSANLPIDNDLYCKCCLKKLPSANALVDLAPSPSKFDYKRNEALDSIFSCSMATTMKDYEEEARPYKSQLFRSLFDSLSMSKGKVNDTPVIVEVGMGTFPNAIYLAQSIQSSSLKSLDIIGVDPNDSMKQYALENAVKSGLSLEDVSLRIVHGVAEALPFEDASVDAVVVTLTLCSVSNPQLAVSEIRRILKPDTGKFVFWEHVLSESDDMLALEQQLLSPLQTLVADGCHLNRRTRSIITAAGFQGEIKHTMMKSADIIGPTIYGIVNA